MRIKSALTVLALVALAANVFAADWYDSDGDGYPDSNVTHVPSEPADNCTLHFNPDQLDSDGDGYGNRCDGDFNQDDQVDFGDLGIMKTSFFQAGDLVTDMNADGQTNFGDLGLLKEAFFATPGPTGADPDQPPCDCYFSGDCQFYGGGFCDYGGPFSQETNCFWRGGPGDDQDAWQSDKPRFADDKRGCSAELELPGAWIASICDGLCSDGSRGSVIGSENPHDVARSIELWAQAMLVPAGEGGGPVDPELAAAANAVQFDRADISIALGRHTADLLALASVQGFADHFCHWEGHPDEPGPVVDLQGNACRLRSGALAIDALSAEMRAPGTGAQYIAQIPEYCSDWQTMFAPRCAAGPEALQCVTGFVEGLAYLLRTPLIEPHDPLDMLLRSAR